MRHDALENYLLVYLIILINKLDLLNIDVASLFFSLKFDLIFDSIVASFFFYQSLPSFILLLSISSYCLFFFLFFFRNVFHFISFTDNEMKFKCVTKCYSYNRSQSHSNRIPIYQKYISSSELKKY